MNQPDYIPPEPAPNEVDLEAQDLILDTGIGILMERAIDGDEEATRTLLTMAEETGTAVKKLTGH